MKKVARSYAWWLGIDKDIKILVKSCNECLQTMNKPFLVLRHPWQLVERPWQRIHNDFAAPFLQQMFLIGIDSFAKTPEVIVIKSTTATNTINKLRSLFSLWGIPEQIVSNNGPQFKSNEFKQFLSENGIITYLTTDPYFSATNGQALCKQ